MAHGDDFNVKCETTGYPKPRIQWLLNDLQLPTSQISHVSYSRNVLSIKNFTSEFQGKLTCLAVAGENNSTAKDSLTIILIKPTESSEPSVLKIEPQSVQAEEGAEVKLVCSSTEQKSEFVWTKEGQTEFAYTYENDGVLTLRNVSKSDAGTYKCGIISKETDTVRKSAEVNVIVTDPIPKYINVAIQPSKLAEMNAGDSVELKCIYSANYNLMNEYEYIWKKNSVPLDNYQNSGRIILNFELKSDSGEYTCQLVDFKNKVKSNVAEINIAVKPLLKIESNKHITRGGREISALENDTVILNCSLRGYDSETISKGLLTDLVWSRSDRENSTLDIVFSNSTFVQLVLSDLTSADSGKYLCILPNVESEPDSLFEAVTLKVDKKYIESNDFI